MNIFFIIYVVVGFLIFESAKSSIKHFLNKKHNQYYSAGFNQAAGHIYKQVTEKGKIDLVLDGKKITLVALKEKE